jgi:hypothetical protein
MNKRLHPDRIPAAGSLLPSARHDPACIPALQPGQPVNPNQIVPYTPPVKKNGTKSPGRREPALQRDTLYTVLRDGNYHVVAESYFYKTEPYYTILSCENEGKTVRPSSSAVLDASVIPICLERAKLAGIPVCDWGISQAYVPLPAILYGLNYFATTAEYTIVTNNDQAKDVIRHITNNGKYPFCFQKFPEGSEVGACTAVFGETAGACGPVASCASKVYDLFGIPLVRLVFVTTGENVFLSSLAPVRYSQLSDTERSLLLAYLSPQELL